MKLLIGLSVLVFGTVGGWLGSIPDHGSWFGGWSMLLSIIGSFAGIWIGFKAGRNWLGL